MEKKKKILLIIATISIGLLCFNNKILNTLAKEYTGQSSLNVGEIYKSGDTINYSIIIKNMNDYPGLYIDFYDENNNPICNNNTAYSRNEINYNCGIDDPINNVYTFPYYPDGKTAYWIVTRGTESMGYNNFMKVNYYPYNSPELSITCENKQDNTNCLLNTTYAFPLKEIKFDLSSKKFTISDVLITNNWKNSGSNNNYILTTTVPNTNASINNPISEQLASFTVAPSKEAISNTNDSTIEDSILVSNISYIDNVTEDSKEDKSATLSVNIESKTTETITENPKTGNKLNYIIASIILFITVIAIIILKKKSLFLKK